MKTILLSALYMASIAEAQMNKISSDANELLVLVEDDQDNIEQIISTK